MADNRNFADKKHRGNRGGVKKRMAMGGPGGLGGPGPMRNFPRPPYLSSANAIPVPYGVPSRPVYGAGMQPNPSGKYGFFDGPQAFGPPGYEKRSDAALKSSGIREGLPIGPPKVIPPPSMIRPPAPGDIVNRDDSNASLSAAAMTERNGSAIPPPSQSPEKDGVLLGETGTEGMNELFAKMVWKKLDLIKDPVRLSRLHIEIMNILQMAIAEETTPKQHS